MCPRCAHQFSYNQQLQAVVGETLRTLGAELIASASYVPLTIPCRCSEPHDGRPDGAHQGCGINFRVDVLPADGA